MIDARIESIERAAIGEKARAMLPILEKFSLDHTSFGADDFAHARALGVTDEAIVDALHVAYLFNIINRMADALRFEIGSDAAFESSATALLKRGYRL